MSNYANITGNLGEDPKAIETKSQRPMAVFTVASNVVKLNRETGRYETVHTNWVPVQAFGPLASRVLSQLRKGDRVHVEGEMRSFERANKSGEIQTKLTIHASQIEFSGLLLSASKQASEGQTFEDASVAVGKGN